MRSRTHLTSPPGQEPLADTPRSVDGDEVYVRGLRLPEEPGVPGRFRHLTVTFGVLVVLAAVAFGVFRLSTAGQSFDPALDGNRPDEVEDGDDPALVPTDPTSPVG